MSLLSECYSSKSNPMGNFLPFDDRNRLLGCNNNIKYTENNILYKMPVTSSIPDTVEFAKFLFPNPARCRETGYLCVVNADSTYNLDRISYYSKDQNYQTITTQAASTQAASTQAASTQAASTQAASTQAASTQAASTQAASTQVIS
jgi:hypothetical protein